MSGETTRDRFAMAAFTASLQRDGLYKADPAHCYELADAMIRARGGVAPQPAGDAVLNALRLAMSRLHRLHIELPHGSNIRMEAREWAEDARNVILAAEKEPSA